MFSWATHVVMAELMATYFASYKSSAVSKTFVFESRTRSCMHGRRPAAQSVNSLLIRTQTGGSKRSFHACREIQIRDSPIVLAMLVHESGRWSAGSG